MANDRFKVTDEERQVMAESTPELLKALEEQKAIAPAWLASWRKKREMGDEAFTQAQELVGKVVESIPQHKEQSLGSWFGFPTDMTRVSPFFPMNRNQLGEREFLRNIVITAAGWGDILYTGPKLSTYEEDTLDAVLSILELQSKFKSEVEVEGKRTYTYNGPMAPLLELLGYNKPGKKEHKRLIDSLELMVSSAVKMQISGGKTKTGKKRPPKVTSISSLLANVCWNEEKQMLSVTVNPFFYEMYCAGRTTLYDMKKRMALKSPIAKSLYRFIQSHRHKKWEGHFLTLCDALNIDREQPHYELRRLLKTAINSLIKESLLTSKSGFMNIDLVTLERTETALPKAEKKAIK